MSLLYLNRYLHSQIKISAYMYVKKTKTIDIYFYNELLRSMYVHGTLEIERNIRIRKRTQNTL